MASSRLTASVQASSTRSSVPSVLIALAISHTDPSTWSTAARSLARQSTSSGTPSSSGALAGRVGSQCRTISQPSVPTSPPVSGGSPASAGVRRASSVPASTSSTSPSRGTPTGTSPDQCGRPSATERVAREATPTNDHRAQVPSTSADSRMKVPGRPCGEGAVQAHRGQLVGQQAPHHRDHPAVGGQLAELRQRGPGRPPRERLRDRRRHGPTTAPRSPPASKQLRAPVWHAAPTWSTRTSSASPSQSSSTDFTCWTFPEVSPLRQ